MLSDVERAKEMTAVGEGPSVLFLCVNYHNEKDTVAFVGDIISQDRGDLVRTIVVDNNGNEQSDKALLKLARQDARVDVLNPRRNLGYFGGAEWGLRHHLNEAHLPDWVIVSNADLSLKGTDFVARLLALYPRDSPAVLAPAIYSAVTGADQNPHLVRRPRRMRIWFYTWVFRYYPVFLVYGVFSLLKDKLGGLGRDAWGTVVRGFDLGGIRPRAIYAPHGSFIMFHRQYFEKGGSLKHGVFMFAEEITVSETVRRLGLRVVYDPRFEVTHREHATTGLFKSRQIVRYLWEASVYCLDEYFR